MKKYLLVIGLLLLTWCAYGIDPSLDDAGTSDASVLDGSSLPDQFVPLRDASISDGGFDFKTPTLGPINYMGGPVLTTPIHVYLIWYGDWSNSPTVPLIDDLITNIGSSNYFQTDTVYYQLPFVDSGVPDAGVVGVPQEAGPPNLQTLDAGPKTYVNSQVVLSKDIFVGYTYGTSLNKTNVISVVTDAITGNLLPSDESGIYFVLSDKTVDQNMLFYQFCADYCGWHDHVLIGLDDIKYGFIGDTERCPADCSAKSDYLSTGHPISPNGDWSADGMSTIIIHELSEAVTDPDINAWQDWSGYENADKCAWTFGPVYITNTNSVANVKVGSKDWLIQQNWMLDEDGGHCTLQP